MEINESGTKWMHSRHKHTYELLKANDRLVMRAYREWVRKEAWHPFMFWGPSRDTLKARYDHLNEMGQELAIWKYHLKTKLNITYGREAVAK
jgi:hypothetical protein